MTGEELDLMEKLVRLRRNEVSDRAYGDFESADFNRQLGDLAEAGAFSVPALQILHGLRMELVNAAVGPRLGNRSRMFNMRLRPE